MQLPLAEPRFLATADARRREVYHSYSKAICPTCRELVDAARILRDGKVYLRKQCPRDGRSEALISGDADWFLRSLTYIKEGSRPHGFSTPVREGCPADCGLCPDHEQHTCLPIVEITNYCNLECPICLVQNRNNYTMTRAEFARILDGLVEKEGCVDTVNLSGGEPTVHPDFLALLDLARRPEIARVSISTNGIRIASDFALCQELARRGVYVNLQLDALTNPALQALRGGGDQLGARERALANLEKAGVRTTIIATVAKGVNDGQIGASVRALLERDFILSLLFQPAAYTGTGGAHFTPHDPLDVLTIPDVIRCVEEQTGGLLQKRDFLPLPCSHPSCFGLSYLLKTDTGYVPFPRFMDLARYLEIIANRGTIRPDEEFETQMKLTMDELWTGAMQIPDSERILRTTKKCLRLMYPPDRVLELEERLRIGESMVKTVFIHGYMDDYTFEVDRIRKCCTHYALPDGRLMPGCAYNAFFRHRDPRFAGPAGKPGSTGFPALVADRKGGNGGEEGNRGK